ncbi:MAG: phosphate ABC transporter permease PstA [Pirellulales bacterium]
MSTTYLAEPPAPARTKPSRSRRPRARTSLLAHGEPMVWLNGGALALALAMIVGMLSLIFAQGVSTFWPQPLYEIHTLDGEQRLGELSRAEAYQLHADELASLRQRPALHARLVAADGWTRRTQMRTADGFVWIDDRTVTKVEQPEWGLVVERREGGRCYGVPSALSGTKQASSSAGPAAIWQEFRELYRGDAPQDASLTLATVDGASLQVPLKTIVRAYPANQLGRAGQLGVYGSRWWEFLSTAPRDANTEGGVFPAIVGTVVMTFFMSLAVVPLGVLAALYLREYARPGLLVSLVRIAVNNLAGVPSVVFGVFGLGFFCYLMGASLDQLFFADKLPSQPTLGKGGLLWASLTLALLTLPVVIVATEEALAAVPGSMREGSYACGASKWQTIRRIVLPRAMPGVMTGLILALARGAGEVAPLMLVGVTNLAFELPVDADFPFVHLDRKFMHLGFHIYGLGYQSPNSEATRPLVYTTTFLLIALVGVLNLAAVWLRSQLRRRYALSKF